MTDAAKAALAVNQAFQALGSERFAAEGTTFIRNRAFPEVPDGNRVTDVRASSQEEIERLMARVEREYGGFPQRRFDVDFRTPPEFEARLALDGYRRDDMLLMVLEGEPVGEANPHDIRPVADDAAWDDYASLHEVDWLGYTEAGSVAGEWSASAMLGCRRAKSPPMRYWLAYVRGEPRAYAASWVGPAGMGQVEDVFTHPDSRHQGLATALIHRCVADCRSQGAGPVVIVAGATDTPKQMYAAMGFRPVAVSRTYWRDVPL